jgi:lysophospholipase L1-like esterase
MLIEFVGDSVTCAYGVDAPDKDTPFSTATENFTKSFAYLTAQSLGADYSAVCFSGHGVVSGYTSGRKITEQTVPQYYGVLGVSPDSITFTVKSDIADISGDDSPITVDYLPGMIEWDFNRRQPDLVVVCLGANDSSYTKGDPAKELEFADAYTDFITQIRGKNPDAAILCTLGTMGEGLFPAVETAVKEYRGKTGDNNVFTMEFERQNPDDGYGADWHPSAATHRKMAEKLTVWIKANI